METHQASRKVRVIAPARLHLGFLDLHGGLGRRYGSLGLAIDRPATDLSVCRAPEPQVRGLEVDRTKGLLERLANALGLENRYFVDVESAIPAHAGLGSGTQLALAIGAALLGLESFDSQPYPRQRIGERTDRGARSAIGMAAFETGGFIVDGGRGAYNSAPPVVIRLPFPEAWRILLVLDPRNEGVHGDKEARAFATLAPFSEAAAAHLCRLVLMRLAPALVEADLAAFGAAVTEIQGIVGSYFATAQGGSAWSHPAVGRIVEKLGRGGAVGLGQSSWGPTGFAFATSEDAAERLYQSVREAATAEGLEIAIARGRNTGASIETIPTTVLTDLRETQKNE